MKNCKDAKAGVIADVFALIAAGDIQNAEQLARSEYPFDPYQAKTRKYTEYQSMKIFLRDGFTDRYSGERLIFPGLLRLLSVVLPGEFPAHKNWKMSESHIVYWELFPTIDHIIPVARGGEDEGNWVTTSMLRNQSKGHWLLEELGWALNEPVTHGEWDGLTGLTLKYLDEHPEYLSVQYIYRWCRSAKRAINSLSLI